MGIEAGGKKTAELLRHVEGLLQEHLPAGKGKNKLVPTFDSGAHDHDKAERPAKRRESPLPGGPSEGGDESEDRLPRIGGTCEDQERAANQGEFESGESAVNLLASLGSGRSPSPTVNTQTDTSSTNGDRMKNDDAAQVVNTLLFSLQVFPLRRGRG